MQQTEPVPSFEQRLDASALTRPMWMLWALSAGLIALDGFDFFIIGVALPFLQQDFGLSGVETGAIAVAAVAGALVGSLTLGPLTDRIGRQRMLVADIALFVVSSAATALAWNALSLVVFRFLVGVGIGADYPISVSYITENVPSRLRGRMVIGAFSFQAVGALLGALTGLGVIAAFQAIAPDAPQVAVQYAWRWMLGVGVLLSIGVALLRLSFLLESPRYYLTKGDYTAASAAASELLNQPISLTPTTDPPRLDERPNYRALFSPRYLRRTALASVPWFLQDIATYGIGIFTPTIIAALTVAQTQGLLTRTFSSTVGSAVVDLFLIAGFGLAIALIDRVGRIPLQVVGFIGMAAGLGVLAIAGDPTRASETPVVLVLTGFILFNLLMNMGPNSTTFLLSGEVFPTAIRASGAGLAAAIAKAGAVLGTFMLPILQEWVGVSPLLVGLAVICLIAAGLTVLLRVETMGRSLDEVEPKTTLRDRAPVASLHTTLGQPGE